MTTPEYLRRPIDPRHLYRRWIDARVYQLRPREVLAYLLDRGWKELSPDRPGYRAFQEPTGTTVDGVPVCQFLPASEADDLPLRMFELVTGLAEYEDRTASRVIDDILLVAGQPPKTNGVASANTGAASLP
jgi:hypothetical protein